MQTSTTRVPLRIVLSEPEALFRVTTVTEVDTVVSSSMPTGSWLERGDGRISGGALGVLADDVLGYAVMVERPADHWSVSSEISIDLCTPVRSGTRLFAEARPVHSDGRGAVTSGQVVDEDGHLVAVCRQHGRFVSAAPQEVSDAAAPTTRDRTAAHPGSLHDLLGVRPEFTERGAAVDLVVTSALTNPLGNLHGGVTLCIADLTAAAAIEAGGAAFETASIHVSYLRPIPLGTRVRFEATVAHSGRTFAVARVDALSETGKLCATATVTAGSR